MAYTGHVWELRYEQGSSFKFYRVYELHDDEAGDSRVLFQWGRIGTKGQSSVQQFTSRAAATNHAMDKRDEKRKKGYETSHHRQLDTVPPEVLHLAAVNERYQVQAQEAVDRNMVAGMMAQLDSAVRLATGTHEDQAQAVEMARDVRISLDDLRAQVLQVESTVDVLDALIVNKLTG